MADEEEQNEQTTNPPVDNSKPTNRPGETASQDEANIRRIVKEVLDAKPQKQADSPASGGTNGSESPRATEERIRQEVDNAVGEKLGEIRKDLSKATKGLKEEAPRTVRRLTKLMWGSDDK